MQCAEISICAMIPYPETVCVPHALYDATALNDHRALNKSEHPFKPAKHYVY